MKYTNEERAKIYENLDKIKAYLDELRPNVRESITVDFGPIKTYANFEREQAYHITVDKNEIRGRSGGLVFDFSNANKGTYETSAYTRLDYAVALIQNWGYVKSTVNTEIQNQKKMLDDINNFEI